MKKKAVFCGQRLSRLRIAGSLEVKWSKFCGACAVRGDAEPQSPPLCIVFKMIMTQLGSIVLRGFRGIISHKPVFFIDRATFLMTRFHSACRGSTGFLHAQDPSIGRHTLVGGL
jgi:hypothetical protein